MPKTTQISTEKLKGLASQNMPIDPYTCKSSIEDQWSYSLKPAQATLVSLAVSNQTYLEGSRKLLLEGVYFSIFYCFEETP